MNINNEAFHALDKTPLSTPEKLVTRLVRAGFYVAKARTNAGERNFAIHQLSNNYWTWMSSDAAHSPSLPTFQACKQNLHEYIKENQ